MQGEKWLPSVQRLPCLRQKRGFRSSILNGSYYDIL